MAATGQTYTTGGAADATLTMFGMQGKQVNVTPGLRLNGTYTGPGGAIEFDEDSATINCGRSASEHAYAVLQTESGINVRIDGGLVLALAGDGRLSSVSGGAECNLGTLTPAGK